MTINIRKLLFIDEFQLSLLAIKRETGRYLFLFFQLIIFADVWKFCRADELLFFNCIISGLLALRNKIEWQKIVLVLLVYGLVILGPIINMGLNVLMLNQYIGYAIRILTACFIASYFKYDFIVKLENLVYVLAYISIPLYFIQVIDPHIFDIFTPISKLIMAGRQNYMTPSGITMHQYIFLFLMNGWAQSRNSGFMWEPAAFGMMLTWSFLLCIYLKRFRWHPRMIIYAIAMLTTFSLGTYSYALLLLLIFIMQNADWRKIVYVIIGAICVVLMLTQTNLLDENVEMMTNKVENYAENSEKRLERTSGMYLIQDTSPKRVDRMSQLFILREILQEAPLGRGMAQWKYSSANGLMTLVVMWGYSILLILIIAYYFFFKQISKIPRIHPHNYIIILSMLVMIMSLIGNPVYNQVFFFVLLIYSFFAKQYNRYERS